MNDIVINKIQKRGRNCAMGKDSLITQEARAMIGKETETVTGVAHLKEIRRFCYAVGDINPLYLDEETAAASRNRGVVAPPMFFEIPTTQEFPLDLLKEDGIVQSRNPVPLKATRSMAGGNEVEFFKPVRPGDVLTRVTKIADIYEKQGSSGPLVFTVFEQRYTNQDGELVAISRVTGISR